MSRIVTGTLTGLEPRDGGWIRYSVSEPGKSYPVRADTKRPELQAQCQALMGQWVQVEINEADSGKPNPHQPGQNFINRYLESIALANGAAPTQQAPMQQAVQQAVPQPQPVQTGGGAPAPAQAQHVVPEHERTRQIRIMRQSCWRDAVALAAAGLIPATPEALAQASEVKMAYVIYGPTRFGVQAFSHGVEQAQAARVQMVDQIQEQIDQPDLTPEPDMPELYVCPDCGTNDPENHGPDCIPF